MHSNQQRKQRFEQLKQFNDFVKHCDQSVKTLCEQLNWDQNQVMVTDCQPMVTEIPAKSMKKQTDISCHLKTCGDQYLTSLLTSSVQSDSHYLNEKPSVDRRQQRKQIDEKLLGKPIDDDFFLGYRSHNNNNTDPSTEQRLALDYYNNNSQLNVTENPVSMSIQTTELLLDDTVIPDQYSSQPNKQSDYKRSERRCVRVDVDNRRLDLNESLNRDFKRRRESYRIKGCPLLHSSKGNTYTEILRKVIDNHSSMAVINEVDDDVDAIHTDPVNSNNTDNNNNNSKSNTNNNHKESDNKRLVVKTNKNNDSYKSDYQYYSRRRRKHKKHDEEEEEKSYKRRKHYYHKH